MIKPQLTKFMNKQSNFFPKGSIQQVTGKCLALDGDDIDILAEEVLVDQLPKNDLCVNSNKDFAIGLDTVITKDLKMEGILRDLIRYVQNFRKDSKLEVSDRIVFSLSGSDEVKQSINQFEDYFKNETLTDSITNDLENREYRVKFKINNKDIEIGISKT